MNSYATVPPQVSVVEIYGAQQDRGVYTATNLGSKNPAIEGKFQPAAVGSGHLMGILLSLILFLLVMRVLYEVAK